MSETEALPEVQDDWAFFIDVDGTLVDIAATPDAVIARPETISTLAALARRFAGALALVSGRPIADVDRLFAPLQLMVAGLHGMERRTAAGKVVRTPVDTRAVTAARAALAPLAARDPGILIEDKGTSIAVHYRNAPEHEAEVLAAADDIAVRSGGGLRLLKGKMVAELRVPGPDKGDVVTRYMAEAPFAGRTPVFVGDDVTDEDGFRAVNRLGGHSIRIGTPQASAARYRLAGVAELRDWLQRAAGSPIRAARAHEAGGRAS